MSGTTLEQCAEQYTQLMKFAAQTKRRWQWIAVASSVASLGLGVALGAALHTQTPQESSRKRGTT